MLSAKGGKFIAAVFTFILLFSFSDVSAAEVVMAEDSRALLPVVVAPEAREEVRHAASSLKDVLERISGAEFEVLEDNEASGITVGVSADFPDAGVADLFDPDDPLRREEYILRSHDNGVLVLGATELAVENAVWDLLYRLGYRQFFPGEVWEVVPELGVVSIAIDVFEKPDFHARRVWYGHGVRPERRDGYEEWRKRNRVRRGFQLHSGHAYGRIIRDNIEEFSENPEFYALVDGERRLAGEWRGNIKFCISNPGLREVVVNHAKRVMKENPQRDSISMDPSDGGNWCECEPCAEMGSISDRVLLLANEVAVAINELDMGDKYVGIYAYGNHSPPPSIDVHPKVIVSATAGFIRGGYTLDEIIEGWQNRGAVMGIYDYFSVMSWDWDLPGRARASSPAYMAESIPDFHSQNIRFHDAESSDNWGPCGLGYYAASRILWDIEEAERVDELKEDYLTRAFGPAKEPMRDFYSLIDGDNNPLLSEDLIGRMYRSIDEALELAGDDPGIRARLLDLAQYTRYVEIWFTDDMMERVRHAYRIRDTGMTHFRGLWQRQRGRLELDAIPEEWEEEGYYEEGDVLAFVEDGIRNSEVFDFEPVAFSEELVPAAPLNLPEVEPGSMGTTYQNHGVQGGYDLYTWFDQPGTISLRITGGLIPHYRNRGNVRVSLYSPSEVTLDAVDSDESVPPDGEERTVELSTPYDGLHELKLRDGGDASRIFWPDNWPMTVPCAPDSRRLPARGLWTLYFYVPEGTQTVAGFTNNSAGSILDGSGETVLNFDDVTTPGHFAIAVPDGEDGSLWAVSRHQGREFQLLTVPPYLARSGKELLLPREVVEADSEQ